MPTTNHKGMPHPQDAPTEANTSSFVSEAMDKTKRMGAVLEQQAEQATRAVGAGMESLGCAIHQHEPQQGVLHGAGEAVAAKLQEGGHYLESKGLEGVGEDLTNLIRQNPVPALLIGVGVGFLLARLLKGA